MATYIEYKQCEGVAENLQCLVRINPKKMATYIEYKQCEGVAETVVARTMSDGFQGIVQQWISVISNPILWCYVILRSGGVNT
ncbi:hypothetical protein CTI12_AA032380 [Artemisia annua]|uniref:Uncharacterized protein n=1 Tax=Artemisia annua TaxID=35608 RepID=A0A2U1QGD2_ARTAN|nr:hypothetical protein CTI12_AA032380 [Artemisia annua]